MNELSEVTVCLLRTSRSYLIWKSKQNGECQRRGWHVISSQLLSLFSILSNKHKFRCSFFYFFFFFGFSMGDKKCFFTRRRFSDSVFSRKENNRKVRIVLFQSSFDGLEGFVLELTLEGWGRWFFVCQKASVPRSWVRIVKGGGSSDLCISGCFKVESYICMDAIYIFFFLYKKNPK